MDEDEAAMAERRRNPKRRWPGFRHKLASEMAGKDWVMGCLEAIRAPATVAEIHRLARATGCRLDENAIAVACVALEQQMHILSLGHLGDFGLGPKGGPSARYILRAEYIDNYPKEGTYKKVVSPPPYPSAKKRVVQKFRLTRSGPGSEFAAKLDQMISAALEKLHERDWC